MEWMVGDDGERKHTRDLLTPVHRKFIEELDTQEWNHVMTIFFFFKDPPPTEIYPLSLPDALPILVVVRQAGVLLLAALISSRGLFAQDGAPPDSLDQVPAMVTATAADEVKVLLRPVEIRYMQQIGRAHV